MKKSVTLAFMLVAMVLGCDKVTPNTNDTTPPEIVIKVKMPNNQYEPATEVEFRGTPIDVMAIVSDTGGVKFIKLSYIDNTSNSCVTTGGTVCNGSFSVSIPDPVQQDLQGDSDGKVVTELPLLTTIAGPFTCKCPDAGGEGTPHGHVLKLRCVGGNWSSNAQVSTAYKDLSITIQ